MFNKREYRIGKKSHRLYIKLNRIGEVLPQHCLLSNSRIENFHKILKKIVRRNLLPGGKNVCSITGSYRSVFNSMLVSRHVYRTLGDTSKLPNYSKLSWVCLIF